MSTVEDVMKRLQSLGIDDPNPGEADFCFRLAQERLLADLGTEAMPDALNLTWVNVAASLYLMEHRASAKEASGASVKSITEGDVRVEYGSSGMADMDGLIARLANPPESLLSAYRKVRW